MRTKDLKALQKIVNERHEYISSPQVEFEDGWRAKWKKVEELEHLQKALNNELRSNQKRASRIRLYRIRHGEYTN